MFINKFLEYENEKRILRDRSSNENKIVRERLRPSELFFYQRTLSMISKITSKIGENTGWEYYHGSFLLPSDFSYQSGEIHFLINRVSPQSISLDDLNDRELAFVSENQAILRRLAKLERKRDSFVQLANPNVIPMEQVESHHKGILDQAFLDDWVCEEAKRFFQKYRAVGVTRLVSLLNMITDSSLDDAYSSIRMMRLSSDLKRELLRWASCFSVKGNRLLERYNDDQDRLRRYDSFPESFMHDESDIILYYKNKK